MVFDIETGDFSDLPIEMRIIRDPLTPVTADTNLDPLTEVHLPANSISKRHVQFRA